MKKKFAEIIEEIKSYGFNFIQDAFIKEEPPIENFEEKDYERLKYKETKLLRLLQSLKNIVERDLIAYYSKINEKKFQFLQLYFKILFLDNNSIKDLNNKKNFFKFTLDPFYRFQLNLSKEENVDQKIENQETVNGLILACEIENFHVLEDSKKYLIEISKLDDDFCQYLYHLTKPMVASLGGGKNEVNNIMKGLKIALNYPQNLVTASRRYLILPSLLEAIRLLLILNPNIHNTTHPNCQNFIDTIRELPRETDCKTSNSDEKNTLKNISFFHKTFYKEKYSDILFCFRQ